MNEAVINQRMCAKNAVIDRIESKEGFHSTMHELLSSLTLIELYFLEHKPGVLDVFLDDIAFSLQEELEEIFLANGLPEIQKFEDQGTYIDNSTVLKEEAPEWLRNSNYSYGTYCADNQILEMHYRGILLLRLRAFIWRELIKRKQKGSNAVSNSGSGNYL